MKKFLEEFKAFALKGNMMDMAIGVLIGGAFSTLVTSLTDNIINPIIGILFQTDFSDVVLHLPFDINLGIGAFISAVINFIILAFVLFCMLKAMNKLSCVGALGASGSAGFSSSAGAGMAASSKPTGSGMGRSGVKISLFISMRNLLFSFRFCYDGFFVGGNHRF